MGVFQTVAGVIPFQPNTLGKKKRMILKRVMRLNIERRYSSVPRSMQGGHYEMFSIIS